jgi:shikimate dehydrogenase
MEKKGNRESRFGLIGRNISYSFSKGYFTKKFVDLGLETHSYENFDLQEIDQFKGLIDRNHTIKGFNVTIPYKEKIIPFLSELDEEARNIGAVNTIKVVKDRTIGYNTDAYGFQKSITPFLMEHHKHALVLGTGGASKAIAYVLKKLGITYTFISRSPDQKQLNYSELDEELLRRNTVLINCTPLGTYPDIHNKPGIPYHFIGPKHLLYDLIYNPDKTEFLRLGEQAGAKIINGSKMLEFQAEKAWEIWNS